MTNLTRWGGTRDYLSLRDAMDRLMEDAFVHFGDWSTGMAAEFTPRVNMYETEDDVVVKAIVPGIRPEDLDISLTGDVLTIRGERKQESQEPKGEGNWHFREWSYGSFQRTLTLPTQVNADKAQTTFENGVLTLTLPKAEEVKPKRLQIKAHNK